MLKKIISFVETSELPTDIANFKVHAFTEEQTKKDHLVIAYGNLESKNPILALGGAGNWSHFLNLFKNTNISAACTQNIFHFTENSIVSVKKFLKNNGIEIRS